MLFELANIHATIRAGAKPLRRVCSSGRIAATPRGASRRFRGRPDRRRSRGARRTKRAGLRGTDRGDAAGRFLDIPRATGRRRRFSYSRALQSSCIKTWGGKPENVDAAQKQLLARAQANGEASNGEYVPGSQPSDEESLFVKNYVY